jgi:hypothetical protein
MSRRPLYYFADKLRRSCRQFPALLMLLAFPILFDLVLIHPVNANDFPAKDTVVCDFPFEALHEFMRVFPHAKIGIFITSASAKHQAYYGKASDKGAASFTVSPQATAEGVHCLEHILIYIFS